MESTCAYSVCAVNPTASWKFDFRLTLKILNTKSNKNYFKLQLHKSVKQHPLHFNLFYCPIYIRYIHGNLNFFFTWTLKGAGREHYCLFMEYLSKRNKYNHVFFFWLRVLQ